MHRQDRNNANNIFGGHLLRLAAELAYSTAVLHAGRHCEAVAMSDVAFKQRVPIGCVLEMRAKVRPAVMRILAAAVAADVARRSCQLDTGAACLLQQRGVRIPPLKWRLSPEKTAPV
jgi:acyl-coenzyme A thioesterase 9